MTDHGRPDLLTFPEGLEIRTGINEVQGCRRAALAEYLGCTDSALKPLLPEPIGQFAHSNKLHPLWDAKIVFDLVDHPGVVVSRKRRSNRVTPRKREAYLAELIHSWDVSGCELVGIIIRGFKSVGDVFVPLDGVTVLLGKNGSGKTNILEAVAGHLGSESVQGRFRDAVSEDAPGERGAEGLGVVFRLRPQDRKDLEAFLEKYLYRMDGRVAQGLEPLFSGLLSDPLVVAWQDRTMGSLQGFGKARLAMSIDDAEKVFVSETTLSAIQKDAWLSNLCRSVAEAPSGVSLIAKLPGAVYLPRVEVAVVDGDPRRLVSELEDRLPKLIENDLPTAEDVGQRMLDEISQGDVGGGDPEWMDGIELIEPVWLSWMAAPSGIPPMGALELAHLSDPEVRLSPPAGDTDWVVLGHGLRVVENVVGVAPTSDREEVVNLISHSTLLALRSIEESDTAFPVPTGHWLLRFADEQRSIGDALGLKLFSKLDIFDKRSPWLIHTAMAAAVRPELLDVLRDIERRANEIAPPFVRRKGRIVLNVLPPATWAASGSRLSVRFALRGNRVLDLVDLGRGTQRWAAASVREALRLTSAELEAENRSDSESGVDSGVDLLLVDEPEMGLHPEAQDQVAAWCVHAGRGGQRVLVATHSPAMLELAPSDATLVNVSMVRGVTHVEPLDVGALEGLDRLADALGLGRSGLLHLPRGFIIVEGPADAAVLAGLLGPELRRQRIVPIPLHGAHKYRALVQPELLKAMGKPMAVMFDDVRRDVLDGRRLPEASEEKTLLTLVERIPEIHPISFDAPDIIAALPDDAVRRVVPEFPGWDVVLDRWRDNPGDFKNFKAYAMHRLGRSERHATQFITEALEQTDPDDALPTSFRRAASEILAWADSISPIDTSDISREELM